MKTYEGNKRIAKIIFEDISLTFYLQGFAVAWMNTIHDNFRFQECSEL